MLKLKLSFVLLMVFCLLANVAVAKEADITLEKSVIEAKIGGINRLGIGQFSLSAEPKICYDEAGEKLAYVQQIDPQGFIIISADDEMEPILGYSLTHNFVWDDHPDNLLYHFVKADVNLRKKLLQYKTVSEKYRIKEKWNRLVFSPVISYVIVT